MKTILIAGGGYADIPLIQAAKRLGFYVVTTGNRPADLGHAYSDKYYQVDYSNCEAILKLAKELSVSAICPCCNDFSALSAAYTAEKLGLPGHDSYDISQIIHHKDRFREFAQENNIPSPKAIGCNNTGEALDRLELLKFPIIIKPVDLSGGKGISVIDKKDEAIKAVENALAISKSKRIVLEEYIDGSRHGFSAFLHDGKISFYFSDNEHYYLNPYMVAAASSPSVVSKYVERALCLESEKIASLLSLKDGILHIQYILKNEKPFIIEVCRRAPGDLYVKFVQYATGVDYPSWIVKASAGIDCEGLSQSQNKGYFTRHCVMAATPGKVNNIVVDESIRENIIEEFMWWKKGDFVTDVLTTKFGIVFLKFDSMGEMINKTNELHKLIKVQTD